VESSTVYISICFWLIRRSMSGLVTSSPRHKRREYLGGVLIVLYK
jgi:hypothetical protein